MIQANGYRAISTALRCVFQSLLQLKHSSFCSHSVCMCSVWLVQSTAIASLNSKRSGFVIITWNVVSELASWSLDTFCTHIIIITIVWLIYHGIHMIREVVFPFNFPCIKNFWHSYCDIVLCITCDLESVTLYFTKLAQSKRPRSVKLSRRTDVILYDTNHMPNIWRATVSLLFVR
jgi:hypothetical protein